MMFGGNFCQKNFCWNFGRDLFAKFSNKSSWSRLYLWCLNSTNRSSPKFEKKLRSWGMLFFGGTFLGHKNPEILGVGGGARKTFSSKKLSFSFFVLVIFNFMPAKSCY
jgi:hypothetical protein